MEGNNDYNDKSKFPRKEDLVSVIMETDHTLQVRILRSDSKMHYHGMLTCPPGTLMHSWLLEITGPMNPGNMRLCNVDPLAEGEYDEEATKKWLVD